ncbi:MAG TPA: pyridoxamine 5'-phosphate oxidase family protein [Chloroflexota bacterium]|nr:pyridoxamine 5'-phosphate oxidase family protein [Chloroflexota bacterium]
MYHQGNRELQARFDSQRLADRLAERAAQRSLRIEDEDRAFIEARDMLFLATADGEGRPNCSYKGGDPGFVRVIDDQTIAFPSYDGNGMYVSTGNTLVNPHVGLLFIDFEGGRRLRLNGEASIDPADPLLAEYPGAELIIRVQVREIFANCPRYIHRYQLVERSRYVPHANTETPIPDWKRSDWARDLLPARDPARKLTEPDASE